MALLPQTDTVGDFIPGEVVQRFGGNSKMRTEFCR